MAGSSALTPSNTPAQERHRAPHDQGQASVDERPGRENERTIKDATVTRLYYWSHDRLRTHLADLVAGDCPWCARQAPPIL